MAMTKKERVELEVTKMRLREANEKIDALFGNQPTNTFMTDHMEQHPLLPDANIQFVLPGSRYIIKARIREGWLEIMGGSRIEITPQAANVIHVRVKPD